MQAEIAWISQGLGDSDKGAPTCPAALGDCVTLGDAGAAVQAEIAEGLGDSDKGGAPHEDKGRKDSSRLGDEGDCACPPLRTVVPVSQVRFARFNSSALHHRDATA